MGEILKKKLSENQRGAKGAYPLDTESASSPLMTNPLNQNKQSAAKGSAISLDSSMSCDYISLDPESKGH